MATPKNADSEALRPAGFFVVRTPHLPIDELRRFGEGLACSTEPAQQGQEPGVALDADRALLRARLGAFIARPEVREAIYVASPSLSQRLRKWHDQPESKDGAKVEQVLVRYLARMAGRATPFGLFASFGIGSIGERTELAITASDLPRRHVRLDMEYVVELAEALERDPEVRARLVYSVNASMYEIAGRIHVPVLTREGESRGYDLVAVEPDATLLAVLDSARAGAPRASLEEVAARTCGSADDGRALVEELIDVGLLQSDLIPPITGKDPLEVLVERVRRASAVGAPLPALAALERVRGALAALNEAPVGADEASYERIAEELAALPAPVNPAHLFQVDMSRGGSFSLGGEVTASITRGIHALHALAPVNEDLRSFARAFVGRYETQEIPLMEALDEEVGIGFRSGSAEAAEPVPLVAGLALRGAAASSPRIAWGAREELLLRKLEGAWAQSAGTVTLTDADLAPLRAMPHSPLPTSLAAFVTLLGPSRVWLHHWTGASGARLLGRFSAWNEELAELLRAHLRDEEAQRPGAIFAEIAHMPPRSRLGNILFRPLLREHEIAFCGRSGAREDAVLGVRDLWISVRNGRVVLRDQKSGREVIPRLTTAHAISERELDVYRFLAALQGQGQTVSASFSWGPFANARQLPRVEYGDVVLSPRQFRLDAADLEPFGALTAADRYRAAAKLRRELGLPRAIGLRDGDNVLPVDLDSSLSIDAFASVVKGREGARLVELFHDEGELVVRVPKGAYPNEMLVPFLHARPAPTAAATPPAGARARPGRPTVRRRFAPGSEWLFAKIYCARGTMDPLLRAVVRPVLDEALGDGDADSWFFLRYADPEPHLRLRLHGDRARLHARVLPLLEGALEPLLASGRVHRLMLATYERELERYGGQAGIAVSERIFRVDSDAALATIAALEGIAEGRERWSFALYGMHRMLEDFATPLPARIQIANLARDAIKAEMSLPKEKEHAILERYRKERAFVGAVLEGGVPPTIRATLDVRSSALQPLVAELREARVTQTFTNLVGSYVHMWNNRVLRARPRAQELLMNTFLAKHYESVLARAPKLG